MYVNGVAVSTVFIRPVRNGFVVRIGLADEVYAPNLRAILRYVAEELGKAEPAAEITDEELEQIVRPKKGGKRS